MSHHAIEKWRLCQIIYEGVDYSSKALLEFMKHGDFVRMTDDAAWKFLEEMAKKPCSGKCLMRSHQPQNQPPHQGVVYIRLKTPL